MIVFFSLFICSVEIYDNSIDLQTLDTYASVDHSPIVLEPTIHEFDLQDIHYSSNLNINSLRGAVEQQFDAGFEVQYQNTLGLVNNFDTKDLTMCL